MALAVVFAPLEVLTQNTSLGVSILQITPSSATGPVGSSVNVIGTIYVSNGSYQIVMGKTVVSYGKADGYYVDANFTVPELPVGPYALTLTDLGINVNSNKQFTITTGYSITASTSSVQEGNSLALTISISGAKSGISYSANVAVVLPNQLGTTYSKIVLLGTVSQKGTASAQVTFPNSSFSPAGSVTDYSGTYTAYFNTSQNLAQTTFSVNFIDSTSYHRGQTVVVRATGYQPNQAATLTVISAIGSTIGTASATASADGLISNALINETNVQVFSNSQKQIRCTLFGIQLSVAVVDFFGNPISNDNVTLNGPEKISQVKAMEKQPSTTSSAATYR
jgi:hypothetical protein